MELFTYRRAKRPLTMIFNLPEAAFVREDKNLPVMLPAANKPLLHLFVFGWDWALKCDNGVLGCVCSCVYISLRPSSLYRSTELCS